MATIACDTCGSTIYLIWGDDELKWTGSCGVCGTIIMFATKEEVTI